ncbi:hypothetical protein C0J52_02325 [Blattella germanica]|nr:hypothetical protein C0J52_02325 [Blattella germanica]
MIIQQQLHLSNNSSLSTYSTFHTVTNIIKFQYKLGHQNKQQLNAIQPSCHTAQQIVNLEVHSILERPT